MKVFGCEIQSRIPLDKNDEIFYLINNVKKENVPFTLIGDGDDDRDGPLPAPSPDRFPPKEVEMLRNRLSSISIIPYAKKTTSYEDQGFYQCGITIHGPISRTILSKTTDVQFSGLHPFILFLKMPKTKISNISLFIK